VLNEKNLPSLLGKLELQVFLLIAGSRQLALKDFTLNRGQKGARTAVTALIQMNDYRVGSRTCELFR
jgi:hypothetical protein